MLVRFADNDCRLVFWRGTGFVPCWVTENGIWYTNEWTETWGSDVSSCANLSWTGIAVSVMSGSSRIRRARTVVQWRYALVDADYKFVAQDIDGRGEWAEEFYIIYPDAIGIRKIDLYYSKAPAKSRLGRGHRAAVPGPASGRRHRGSRSHRCSTCGESPGIIPGERVCPWR
ncbi:MAG: hypothetical protein M0C28_39925 [Candidatus Moduliflexus flocculans]|nr:hypothetical protein [Candidatus Moduliflexus flocculans]